MNQGGFVFDLPLRRLRAVPGEDAFEFAAQVQWGSVSVSPALMPALPSMHGARVFVDAFAPGCVCGHLDELSLEPDVLRGVIRIEPAALRYVRAGSILSVMAYPGCRLGYLTLATICSINEAGLPDQAIRVPAVAISARYQEARNGA